MERVDVTSFAARHETPFPGAKFVVMRDCGHRSRFEDPDTFNRIDIEFLLGG
jgi:pimeloyl-ACP methyl ester carboxylesterase